MKRKITKRQEQIFRTCHQDFEGLSQVEAAKKLNINQSTILRALRQVEKVFPDMFPILTKLEAQVYHYYMDEGWSVIEISEHMDKRISTIYKTLYRAKDKGAFFADAKGRTLSYEPGMDANVKHQF